MMKDKYSFIALYLQDLQEKENDLHVKKIIEEEKEDVFNLTIRIAKGSSREIVLWREKARRGIFDRYDRNTNLVTFSLCKCTNCDFRTVSLFLIPIRVGSKGFRPSHDCPPIVK